MRQWLNIMGVYITRKISYRFSCFNSHCGYVLPLKINVRHIFSSLPIKVFLICIFEFACYVSSYAASVSKKDAEIAQVMSGRIQEAKASWWGFNAEDATDCLQNAINSGVKRLIVDNMGSEWLVRPIYLRSNQEIIFAENVVVRAMPGAFKGLGDSLFTARELSNVILRGEKNAVLKMNKKDYQDTASYQWSEWRHLISLRGCENVKLENLILKSSGGDGIYVSTDSKLQGCRNILIDKVICEDHHRQGMSIISAENLLVRNSIFRNTRGTPPACGVDLEPNTEKNYLINNIFENCEFSGNASAGIIVHCPALNEKSKPVSVKIRNCRSVDNTHVGISLYTSSSTSVKGQILIEDCDVKNNHGGALIMSNQQDTGLQITVKNTKLDNKNSNYPGIVLDNSTISNDIGGIRFENVRLLPGRNTPVVFHGMTGVGIREFTGSLSLQNDNGKITDFDLAKFSAAHPPRPELRNFSVMPVDLKKLHPVDASAARRDKNNKSRFRGRFRFLQYCPAAGVYPIRFNAVKVTKFPLNLEVRLRDAAGTDLGRFSITEPEKTYLLKANGRNLFSFEINTKGHAVTVNSPHPGQAVRTDDWVGMFGGGNHQFYFSVPAGVKEINIDVAGTLREPVSAQLISPDGKVVTEVKMLEGMKRLHHNREKADASEIWCLKFPYGREDFKFRVGAPLLPLVSFAPEFLLKQ